MTSVVAPLPSLHKTWVAGLAASTKPEPGHGALFGKQWEARFTAQALYEAGFTDALELLTMNCIGGAESQWFDHAIHVNLPNDQGVIYEDRGWLQLSSVHKDITDEIAYDIWEAAKAARKLVVAKQKENSNNSGFEDWVAYWHVVGGAPIYEHDSYLGRGGRGVGNYLIDVLLNDPMPDVEQAYQHKFKTPVLSYEHRVAGMKYHVKEARRELGAGAKSAAVVRAVQEELAKAEAAAVPAVPQV